MFYGLDLEGSPDVPVNFKNSTTFWASLQKTLWRGNMLGIGSGSFDPETLVILETAFDEAWITLKANGRWSAHCPLSGRSGHTWACVASPASVADDPEQT